MTNTHHQWYKKFSETESQKFETEYQQNPSAIKCRLCEESTLTCSNDGTSAYRFYGLDVCHSCNDKVKDESFRRWAEHRYFQILRRPCPRKRNRESQPLKNSKLLGHKFDRMILDDPQGEPETTKTTE